MTEPKKRRWVLFLVAAAVLAAAGVAALRFLVVWPEPPGTEYTDASFRDNAERLRFVRNVLQFEVPDETQVEKVHFVSWLDVTCDCTLRLSPEGMQQVKSAIDDEWHEEGGSFKLERGAYSCEITFLPDDASISVKESYGSGPQPGK